MTRRPSFAHELIFFSIATCVSLAFGTLLGAKQVTDPFVYFDSSFVQSVLGSARMVIPHQGPFTSLNYVPGREILMTQYCSMLGIEPQKLQFLPVGAVFVSTSVYALSRRVLDSAAAAAFLTIYLMTNLSHATALYSIFAYALAFPLLCAAIAVSLETMRDKTVTGVLLLLFLFIGAHLIHYTIATWVITFVTGANFSVWAWKRFLPAARLGFIEIWHILITTVVIFVAFNQTIYHSYLPLIGAQTLDSAIQRSLSFLSLAYVNDRSPYLYSRAALLGLASTATLALVIIPLAYCSIGLLWRFVSKRGGSVYLCEWLPFITGVAVLAAVDSLSYAIRGSISTKSWSMVLPLLSVLLVLLFRGRRVAVGFAAVLMLASVAKAAVFYNNSYVLASSPTNSNSAQIAPSARWLSSHAGKSNFVILADLNLYGKYLMAARDPGRVPVDQGFTIDRFEQVVGSSEQPWATPPDVVAIDLHSSEPTIGFVFQLFQPLAVYSSRIANNQSLNVVYDDGAVWLGVPTD